MKLGKNLVGLLTVLAMLFSFGPTSADAKAGAKCPKVGQTRKFKGVLYTCLANKSGKKTTNIWVLTLVQEAEKNIVAVGHNCGAAFENSQYPEFQLDKLSSVSTQSLFFFGKTIDCQMKVSWTPSKSSAINTQRNVSLCFYEFPKWPESQIVINIGCDNAVYLDASGTVLVEMDKPTSNPYFGFIVYEVKGYLGDTVEPVWNSALHLVMYDFDCVGVCEYYPLQKVYK